MLLCALHRAGKPRTASDLHDEATALAMDHDWPRAAYCIWSPQKVAAALRNMDGKLVERCGKARIEGNERDLWRPLGLLERWENRDYPVPDPPGAGTDHPLETLSRAQQITAFDVLGEVVAAGVRLRRNVETLLAHELQTFDDTVARCRRQLLAIGVTNDDREEV